MLFWPRRKEKNPEGFLHKLREKDINPFSLYNISMANVLQKIRTLFEDDSIFEKEQKLWKDTAILEKRAQKETIETKKQELLLEIGNLKNEIKDLYESDPTKLKYRIQELEKALMEEGQENSEAKSLAKYLGYICDKNLDKIQKQTAEELKQLVDFDSLDFDMIVEKLRPSDYSYENDFLIALENWFYFLQNEFCKITSKTNNYLLNANEILQLQTGSQADISILTCAIMHKLGDYNAKVTVAEMDDFSTLHFVVTKYKNKELIFDFFNSEKFDEYLGEEKDIFEKYKPDGKSIRTIKYAFNRYVFEQG